MDTPNRPSGAGAFKTLTRRRGLWSLRRHGQQHLQRLLDRAGPSWEVINLGMMGWNTVNELAALRVFLPTLKPDGVVICPTSNDIDDSYKIWNGHLVRAGFDSAAIFRNSYACPPTAAHGQVSA